MKAVLQKSRPSTIERPSRSCYASPIQPRSPVRQRQQAALLFRMLAIASCVHTAVCPALFGQGFQLTSPVSPASISQSYNHQYCSTGGRFHAGYDYVNAGRLDILAAAPGTVILPNETNFNHGLGNVIILKHTLASGANVYTLYGHLDSISVAAGQCVTRGQKIGVMGATGSGSNGVVHLHFEVKDAAVLNNPSGGSPCGTSSCTAGSGYPCWGYTPANPDNYGYHDPGSYIGHVAVTDGSSEFFRVNGGPPVHPTGTFIKTASDNTIYLIRGPDQHFPDVHRDGVSTESAFHNPYNQPYNGSQFEFGSVITVAQDEMSLYPIGGAISLPFTLVGNGRGQPDGKLIIAAAGSEISAVTDNGARRPFSLGSTFLGLGYQFCNVTTVADYSSYNPVGLVVDGTRTGTAPGVPSVPSPSDGATSVSTNPTLSWSRGSGATSHDVYFGISTSPPFVTNTSGSNYSPGTLAGAVTYYWRVVAKNSTGSTSSPVWSFTTVAQTETVSASTLNGLTQGYTNTSYTYSTSGAASSLGHTLQYYFDWGDGTNSGWISSSSASHAWSSTGTFSIGAQARCATHTNIVSAWSNTVKVTTSIAEAVSAPTLNGLTQGYVNTSYTYSTSGAASNLGHTLQYYFDWGDGSSSGWISSSSASHAWATTGTYRVKGQARCATHIIAVSPFSNMVSVSITQASNGPDLLITSLTAPTSAVAGGQISVSPTVANQGNAAAGPFRVEFYFSSTSTISTSSVDTGWGCDIGGLGAGATTTCNGPITVPASLTSGTWYFGVIADPSNQVAELNESNNSRAADTGPVTVGGTRTIKAGIFRNGLWAIDTNRNGQWDASDKYVWLGQAGDIPIVGDFDGDGTVEMGVYRSGFWAIDINHNGLWDGGDLYVWLGQAGDVPVVGDFNGDGRDDMGIFRNGLWAIDVNHSGQWDVSDKFVWLGQAGDVPVVGDFNGDGTAEMGVFRSGFWAIDMNRNGVWDASDKYVWLGQAGDVPAVGDFNGDGIAEMGVFRGGFWAIDLNRNGMWDVSDTYLWLGGTADVSIVLR